MLVSRVSDIGAGRCPSHDSPKNYNTVFVNGAVTVFAENSPAMRVGDVGIGSCGHPTVVLVGAVTSFAEVSPIHRVGDVGTGNGPYVSLIGAVTVRAT